jgi:tetratricopeptide (TPR) repeat protein
VTARDWSRAREIANELLAYCDENRDGANAGCAANAAITLVYAGYHAEAWKALEKAYALALETGAAHSQLWAAMALSGLAFDLGFEADHEYWAAKSAPILREAPHLANDVDFIVGRAIVAFHKGNAALAAEAINEGEAVGLFSTPIRARWKRAFELGISSLRRPPSDSEEVLARKLAADRLHSLNGVRDLEICVACQVLTARGQKAFAEQVLRRFLEAERGHHASFSPGFSRVMEQLGVSYEQGRLLEAPPATANARARPASETLGRILRQAGDTFSGRQTTQGRP